MIGLGIGVGWATKRRLVNYINELIKQFKDRVAAEGGTFEAEQCLKNSLPALIENEPSLCVTPNAVEEGKLFSIIPTDGSGDLTVVRATTATRVNSAGLIESVANNVPRLDYTNSSCPSILVEPQRTNLVLRSNELSTAPNVLDNVTGTSNFYVSPDGSINAIKLAETVVNDRHGFYQYFNVTAQTYTISVFTKQIGRRYISLMSDFTGTNSLSFFDLQEKVVVSNGTGFTCSIEEYSDGWFRLSATVTASAGLKYIIFGGSTNGTTNTYIGNTSTFMTFYGFQLEAGSNATSYIPTVGSTVTRNADNISKTGIADLIGQTEGVLYANVKFNSLGTGDSWLTISSGTNANWIFIGKASNKIRAYVKGNNSVVFDNSVTNITSNQLMKIAIAYKSGNIALYINGSLIATSTNSFTFSSDLSLFALDSSSGISENISETTIYQEIILFKNRLTNTELAQLTTL
jgi:hypothetical protein